MSKHPTSHPQQSGSQADRPSTAAKWLARAAVAGALLGGVAGCDDSEINLAPQTTIPNTKITPKEIKPKEDSIIRDFLIPDGEVDMPGWSADIKKQQENHKSMPTEEAVYKKIKEVMFPALPEKLARTCAKIIHNRQQKAAAVMFNASGKVSETAFIEYMSSTKYDPALFASETRAYKKALDMLDKFFGVYLRFDDINPPEPPVITKNTPFEVVNPPFGQPF